jgi:hypothetical protein
MVTVDSYHWLLELKEQGILTNSLKRTDSIIPTFHQINHFPPFTTRNNAPAAP